ncbi:MAG: hypothetical protein IPL61_13335 [Myxococcales bacterium]|nr:hypothetical protein [Myxococcales bacterium]
MGWERDGIGLFGTWEVDDDVMGAWLAPDTLRECLLAPLRADGSLERATHVWVSDGKPRAIGSAADLDKQVGAWRGEIAQLYSGDLDDPDFMVHVTLDRTGFRLALGLGGALVDGTTRARVAGLVSAWSARFAKRRCHLTVAYLSSHAPYPRARPPRESMTWPLGGLDYHLGRTWHRADSERAAVLAAIERARLPKGATRTADGDVVRVAFGAELTDPRAVADARAVAERWLAPLVSAEIEDGWNQLGDRMVVPTERDELVPFTFYDSDERVGYKGLIVDPDTGAVDEAAWSELVGIAASGEAHDGTPVGSVRLVLPTRRAALAVHERAIASGFEMATYPKNDVLWEVHPL